MHATVTTSRTLDQPRVEVFLTAQIEQHIERIAPGLARDVGRMMG
jgi:hypothetical protein